MKRNILFGSVLAAALSVGLAAQAPTGAPQDPAAPPSSPRPAPSAQAPSAKDDSSSKSKSDLTKYVNSKVEIKGKLDSAGGAMSSSSSGPTLHVDSVKQISPSCTQ
jgi:hypothetical protein